MGEDTDHHFFRESELDSQVVGMDAASGQVHDLVEVIGRRVAQQADEQARHFQPFRRPFDLLVDLDRARELHSVVESRGRLLRILGTGADGPRRHLVMEAHG